MRFLINRFKRRPDTFIVGFQKCGTTSLYNYLVETQAYTPGTVKENDKLISKGDYFNKYLFRFPWKWGSTRTLCASHLVGFNPIGIRRLKVHFPDAKYIFITRNPIDRAWSRYQHNQRKNGNIDKKFEMSFDELVDFELELLSGIDITNINTIYDVTSKINPFGLPISRGLYNPYIQKFKDEGLNTYEMQLELLNLNFEEEMIKLFKYLDLDANVPKQEIFNKAPSKTFMKTKTKEKLTTFYLENGYNLN